MDYTIFWQRGLTLAGIIIANVGLKFGRAAPLIKDIYETIKYYEEAKKDGVLTIKEKATLYDEIGETLKEAWDIIKGFTPFKKK